MTKESLLDAAPQEIMEHNGVQFHAFTAEYENFDRREVKHTFHFAQPGRRHLITLSKAEKSKQFDALENVLAQVVHPDQRADLKAVLKAEPVLTTSYADAILRRCGAQSVELGN
jgi:hypothetical protein